MEAIRKKIKRNGNKVVVELPDDFKAENLELIILPLEEIDEDELSIWRNFSISNLENAYDIEEPDYSNVQVKESNHLFQKM